MEFAGEWHQFPDGKVRPAIRIQVRGADGHLYPEYFLLDTGADGTVFSAFLLNTLRLPTALPPAGSVLGGIGGPAPHVLVSAEMLLQTTEGVLFQLPGQFAAFTHYGTTDHSLLGREILDCFDLIVGRNKGEIRLLCGIHFYEIRSP